MVGARRVNAVLVSDDFPELRADLVACESGGGGVRGGAIGETRSPAKCGTNTSQVDYLTHRTGRPGGELTRAWTKGRGGGGR